MVFGARPRVSDLGREDRGVWRTHAHNSTPPPLDCECIRTRRLSSCRLPAVPSPTIKAMLCSISTGKSGSKWLDRLRSAKGFPTGNDDDLEHFLTHRDPNLSNSPVAKPSDPKSISDSACSDKKPVHDRSQPPETGEKEWFGIMSNVLAELFNMGGSDQIPRLSGKKSSRKQTNPKICLLSSVRREDGVPATAPSSGDNSLTEMKDSNGEVKTVNQGKADCLDAEEEKCNQDLSAYSRSEVTVIDTSCPVWKFEKLLFRKMNVWKVRDKKGKPRNVGRKKRKAGECDEQLEAKKKLKLSAESSKESNEEDYAKPSNEEQNPHNAKREESKETSDGLSQVPKKRSPFSRSPRKLREGGSSVLDRGGKKPSTNLPNITIKDAPRRPKA